MNKNNSRQKKQKKTCLNQQKRREKGIDFVQIENDGNIGNFKSFGVVTDKIFSARNFRQLSKKLTSRSHSATIYFFHTNV